MKRKILSMFTLVGAVLVSSCEKSVEPRVSEDELIQYALDRFEKNEGISYQMFEILTDRMTSDSLAILEKKALSKASFIDVVARQTDDYFLEVVEGGVSEFELNDNGIPIPYSYKAESMLKNLASMPAAVGSSPNDVVDAYSNLILKQINEQAANGHKDWIIIESLRSTSTTESDQPTESVALNYGKIKMMATIPHTIIMDMSLTDDQVLSTINDVLNSHQIPPVAIGLLLPAVQKIREANATNDQPFRDSMKGWLDGPIAKALNGNLDRDIIRRVQAASYLAALHTIILDDYKGTNEDIASLSTLHARYRSAVIVATEALWDE